MEQASIGSILPIDAPVVDIEMSMKQGTHLGKDGRAQVNDRVEHVEALLFPYFFPSNTGVFCKLSNRFSSFEYLRMRCRQAFTPFTKLSVYLLLLRSIECCKQVIKAALEKKMVVNA